MYNLRQTGGLREGGVDEDLLGFDEISVFVGRFVARLRQERDSQEQGVDATGYVKTAHGYNNVSRDLCKHNLLVD